MTKNPGGLLKNIATLQSKMAAMQKEIASTEFTGTAGGMVTAVVRGDGHVTKIEIQPEAMQETADLLADMVAAAVNNAATKKEEFAKSKLASVAGGMLPAGINLSGMLG